MNRYKEIDGNKPDVADNDEKQQKNEDGVLETQ